VPVAMTKSQLERFIKGATGQVEADLIVTNGKLVNVLTPRKILEGFEIAVLEGQICYVDPQYKAYTGQ
jgi:adenine deaminase